MADRIANSTVGQAVFRGDGVRLYGLDAELELKAQSKRNPEYEKELANWIEQATGMKMEYKDDLIESLRSGIVLCTLINTLLPGTITKINSKPLALMQIENITLYLKGCWKVGVPSSDLFVTSDLYLRKDIPAVLQNIASVARSSHTCPDYHGPTFGIKPPSQPMVKKWDDVKFSAPLTVADLEKNTVSLNCDSCGKSKSCLNCDYKEQSQPSNNNNNNNIELKEKDSKIQSLDKLVREQENKVREQENKVKEKENKVREQELQIEKLSKSIDSQKKQFEINEIQFKSTIESQSEQIKSKEKQIQNLTNSISNNNRVGSTLINSNVVQSTPSSTTSTTTKSHLIVPVINNLKENRFSVKIENINCSKCNFPNSKVSKYCISCGGDIKKDNIIVPIVTTTTTTPVNNNNNNSTTNKNNGSVVVQENEQLNERVQLLCNTIKEQEDSISKLNKQMKNDLDSFEKRLKDQKQVIDNQQLLLTQRDQDLKKLIDENKKIQSSTTTIKSNINNATGTTTPSFITPTKHSQIINQQQQTQQEITLNNQSNNQPNRISFSVSSGYHRKTQVGPSSYNSNQVGSSVYLPPLPSSTINNINNNNVSTYSSNNVKEIEELKSMIKLLESKLNEEVTKNRVKDSTIKVLEDKISTIQHRPTRKQALANSQVVVGRKRFTTLKPDGLDSRLVETTLSYINDILFSRSIEFHQVQSLNALFKTEEGRRRFSQILQQSLKHLPTLSLSDSSFEFMLFLLNTILQEMDYSKDHNDFITAKVIFNSSDILYRVNERTNEKDYLKNYIKVGMVWKKIQFWEDMFYNLMAKKHRNLQGGTMERVDRDIVRNLLSYLGVNMIQFNLSIDEVSKFINEMAQTNQIPSSDLNVILSNIKNQEQIQSIVVNQKQKQQSTSNTTSSTPMKPDLSTKSKRDTKKDKKK